MCFLCREQITLGCQLGVVRSPKTSRCEQKRSRSSRRRLKTRSSSSRSRSSGTSRYSGRYSRSPSLSSCRYIKVACTFGHFQRKRTAFPLVLHLTFFTLKYLIKYINYCLELQLCLIVARTRALWAIHQIWGEEAAWPAWAPEEATPDTVLTGELYEGFQLLITPHYWYVRANIYWHL